MTNHITRTYTEITDPKNKVSHEVLRAFIRTDRAFEMAMCSRGPIEYKHAWNRTNEIGKSNATVLDLPTYQHLPEEFLKFSDSEKAEFIKELCIQNDDVNQKNGKK